MAYKQYTRCADPLMAPTSNQYLRPILTMTPVLIIGALLAALRGQVALLLPVLEAGGCVWLLVYTSWWLHRRLLCLGGDRSAVGLLLSLERPEDKELFDHYDSDFNLDLLLPPGMIGESQPEAEQKAFQRTLIAETAMTAALALPFMGEEGADSKTAILHVEIEGGGMFWLDRVVWAGLAAAVAI